MESDLISRQAAIRLITGYNGVVDKSVAKRLLIQMPSAQPERKRGHWIEVDDSYNRISGRCSVCGWESHMYEDDVVGMDFCPHCGADLRGGSHVKYD